MELVTKCYSCGGEIVFAGDENTAVCEYCGRTNARPKSQPNELELMKYSNERLSFGEFDEAETGYRKVLQRTPDEHEARWGLLLCKYGVQYVEDAKTKTRLPTCRRSLPTSFCAEPDFRLACAAAPMAVRMEYEKDGRYIDDIQKEIRRLKSVGERYDIFLCYKETDENGRRTRDSVLAQNLYQTLKLHGFSVFYAPISLKKCLGANYEAAIFCALESSQVMLVLATKPEYLRTTWVKSEWRRYLSRIDQGEDKLLIPLYRDFTPDRLPREFNDRFLQGLDMGNFSFMPDLESFLSGMLKEPEPEPEPEKEESAKLDMLIKCGRMELEDGDFSAAQAFFADALKEDPESPRGNLGMAMAMLKASNEDALVSICINTENWYELKYLRRFKRYGGDEAAELIDRIRSAVEEENARREAERIEAERIAAEQARLEEERKAAEQARVEAERIAAEQARLEEERKAAERARLELERIAAEQKSAEQARLAMRLAAEQARIEAERKKQDEERLAEQRKADLARLAMSRAAEQARIEEEQRRALIARFIAVLLHRKARHEETRRWLDEQLRKSLAERERVLTERNRAEKEVAARKQQEEKLRDAAMRKQLEEKLREAVGGNPLYQYRTGANGVVIISYIGNEGGVDVPEQINGLRVTEIADQAFAKRPDLKIVRLPGSVRKIGKGAFQDCPALIAVEIPEGVTDIGDSAFSGCRKLREITLPKSLRRLGQRAFFQCDTLREATVPGGLTELKDGAFAFCVSLNKVRLSSGLQSIGCSAFESCLSLEEISIPDSVSAIGMRCFSECVDLRRVKLPSKLTKIDADVFSGCMELTQISIPGSVRAIERDAFRNCKKLKQLDVPKLAAVKEQNNPGMKIKKPWFW